MRTAQMTAALEKAWVQPKLSFISKPAKNIAQPRDKQETKGYTRQLGESVGAQGNGAAKQMPEDSVTNTLLGAVQEASSTIPMNLDSPHGKLWIKTLFEGWQTHFSSNCIADTAPKQERSRSGSGGVIVACRKTGPGCAFQRTEDVPQRLAGHFELLKSSKYNLLLVGVYMPCNDQQKRTEPYNFLGIVAKEAFRAKADLIAAGDWNAAWQSTDKSSRNLSRKVV